MKCINCEKDLNGLDHHDGMCFECMNNDYPLIPMAQITDEARNIAVLWHENATDWIGDKHKLASDIMNYARRAQEKMPIHIREGITNTKVSIQDGEIIVEPNTNDEDGK